MIDADQCFPAIETEGFNVVHVIGGDPVIEFPRGANYAPAVHGADRQLVIECSQPSELFQNVSTGQHSIDLRQGKTANQTIQQGVTVRHRDLVLAERNLSPRGVVGRKNQQVAIVPCDAAAAPRYEGFGQSVGGEDSLIQEGLIFFTAQGHRDAPIIVSNSATVGIASAHVRRVATSAPAALANSPMRSKSHSLSTP